MKPPVLEKAQTGILRQGLPIAATACQRSAFAENSINCSDFYSYKDNKNVR
ncbi:MAG: hypothetical protein ABI642_07850 [Polaromonas sp.]